MSIGFSVIVPTYNRAALIAATLRSLLAMEYDNFEVIVVDDGSKDNTADVVAAIGDSRLSYYKKENGERGAARNYGVQKATKDYVTFLDSDDLVYPNHLSEAAKLVEQCQQPEFFHLAHQWVDPEGKVLKKYNNLAGDLNKKLLAGNIFSCIGVFIKRGVALQYPFYEDRKLAGTEDWLLWLQLAARYKIYYSNTITSALVHHDERSVLGFNTQAMLDRTNILVSQLKADQTFMAKYGTHVADVEAHMYSYIAIHLAIDKHKRDAINFLLKATRLNIKELFTKRALAIVRKVVM